MTPSDALIIAFSLAFFALLLLVMSKIERDAMVRHQTRMDAFTARVQAIRERGRG